MYPTVNVRLQTRRMAGTPSLRRGPTPPVHPPQASPPTAPLSPRQAALLLALVLSVVDPRRLRGEDRAQYRYEDYNEDGARMRTQTHAIWFEYDLHSKLALRGQYVHDTISGATPTGGLPAPGEEVQTVRMEDQRNAFYLETAIKAGRTTTTPQIAFSNESDYQSLGLSVNESIDFNQRNTTLNFGVAHNQDRVKGFWQAQFQYKSTTDFLLGFTQLLGPATVFNANVILGYADGYLTDPYKGITAYFDLPPAGYDPANPNIDALPWWNTAAEVRPGHRFKQVAFASLSHALARWRAGAEVTYRFHHDDWGITAHTAGFTWNQKLFSRVVVSPLVRFHVQSQADFYLLSLPTDPTFGGSRLAFQGDTFIAQEGDGFFESEVLAHPGAYTIVDVPSAPAYYSADYRLSHLRTLTLGVAITVRVTDQVSLEGAYKRYTMEGLDGRTPSANYPSAHVFTIGMGLPF